MTKKKSKLIVVMPAYNAEKTLEMTYNDLPQNIIDKVILVDDKSTDNTVEIAKKLGIKVFLHRNNYGYGANQKTCYIEAIKENADIIIMVHPDYQYDPKIIPQLIIPIISKECDVVLGSRMLGISPYKQGMPFWKFFANKFLTSYENKIFKLNLSEYHTGSRAYSRKALEQINFISNSDSFIFDQEIIAQFVLKNITIHEKSIPVRYFPEASSIGFIKSCIYGLNILWVGIKFLITKHKLYTFKIFEVLSERYVESK